MQIIVGSDHGGYALKEELKKRLLERGHHVSDVGCDGQPVDYPDVARQACDALLQNGADFAVLCCGTGIGISMAANKIDGIRAALCCDAYSARMCKEHNDANVIAFGGRTIGVEHAWTMLEAYMSAKHLGGIHADRVQKMMALERR